MFGTAIAVFDGYSRSVARIVTLLMHSQKREYLVREDVVDDNEIKENSEKKIETKKIQYNATLVLLAGVAFGILLYTDVLNPNTKSKGFKSLVDFTTALSFVVAPVIAILNLILVQGKYVGENFEPPVWKKVLGYAGVVFLSAFTVFYFKSLEKLFFYPVTYKYYFRAIIN